MAASMAVASRLSNLRNPALQSLIRRHLLLHPAAALPEARSINPIHLEKDSTNRYAPDSRNQNLQSPKLPLDLQFGFGSFQFGYGSSPGNTWDPVEDDYQHSEDEDDIHDNYVDEEDEDEDDSEFQDSNGSDSDDDDN